MAHISEEDAALCRNILRVLSKTWERFGEGFLSSSFGSSFMKALTQAGMDVERNLPVFISEKRESEKKLKVDFLVNDRFPIIVREQKKTTERDLKELQEILHHIEHPEGLIVNLDAEDFFGLYRRVRREE